MNTDALLTQIGIWYHNPIFPFISTLFPPYFKKKSSRHDRYDYRHERSGFFDTPPNILLSKYQSISIF